jgi:putative membrane protein
MSIADLPALNATLNGISAILLTIGWWLIHERRRINAHRNVMIAACVTSSLFLVSYVIYHAHIGSKPFPGTGAIRIVYFTILIPHVVLAALVLPFQIITLVTGLKRRDATHHRIAEWTLPVWWFVSVTGVIVYVMLYRLY